MVTSTSTSRRFTPRSRQAWRSWLQAHHAEHAEVWVVFYKRHTGKPTLSYNDAVEEAVCFGWIDGVKRSLDDQRYMHRFSPRQPNSKWSATNRERAERMIKAGLMVPSGLKMIRRAKRAGTWETEPVAASKNASVPPELAAKLRRNARAARFFESLAPSYRRQFTGWINSAKREVTRRRRIDEAVALLARGEKLGMR
jgi:uncharacterized protein YdeI (YjbR/CyaY-like superfamily)